MTPQDKERYTRWGLTQEEMNALDWWLTHKQELMEYFSNALHRSLCATYYVDFEKEEQEAKAKSVARKKESNRRYRQGVKGKEAQKRANYKRRARLKTVPCTLTASQWRDIKRTFNHKCAYCGKKAVLEQDHLVPVSKGGAHTAANIVPACRKCNLRKHDSHLLNFLMQ